MFRLLVLLIAGYAHASQSLVLTTGVANASANMPSTSGYNNIGSWRIEGQLDNLTTPSALSGIFEFNSGASIRVTTARALQVVDFTGSGGCSIALGSSTNVRFIWYRDNSLGTMGLEVWDTTAGTYTACSATYAAATRDFRSEGFSIGSYYEGGGSGNMNVHIGFLRFYSSILALNGNPPNRTGGTGNLLNFEFEGNLTDSSPGAVSFSMPGATYATTVTANPTVRLASQPITIRTATASAFDASASWSNIDNPAFTCAWTQTAGTAGTITNGSSCSATTFSAPSFGQYTLQVAVTDTSAGTTNYPVTFGAVPTDDLDIVSGTTPTINSLIGRMVRYGANAWSWADNRNKALVDTYAGVLNTYYPDYWSSAGTGTLSATKNSATLTFTGVNAQTVFCGGGSSPVTATSGIYVWYPSPDYAGSYGRGRYTVTACPTSATVTINNPTGLGGYQHSAGTTAGLQYSVINPGTYEAQYSYSPIPFNYYDTCLAAYSLYYRTGLTTYQTTARTVCDLFWRGPNYDLGNAYNITAFNGAYIIGGPARSQSAVGLILWSLDTGTNIWPGMHHLWDYWIYSADYYIAQGQISDAREFSRIMGGMALCAQYDTDATYRSNCATKLGAMLDFMTTMEINNHWTNTTATNAQYAAADGSVYVTVTDGSPNITLTGGTWSASTFTVNTFGQARLWFTTPKTNVNLAGNKNSDAGDSVDYAISSVTDPTHAVMATNYNSGSCPSGCQKGLVVSWLTGFGWQPYQFGNWMSILGTYVFNYYASQGDSTRMAQVKGFVARGTAYLAANGWHSADKSMYAARGFLSCEPDPHTSLCTDIGALSQAAEALPAFGADWLLSRTAGSKTTADEIYQAMYCKPGYACPFPTTATTCSGYLVDLEESSCGGYMLTYPPFYISKFVGFFGGYGFMGQWPGVRNLESTRTSLVISGKSEQSGKLVE